jgi:tetratricopeptide (TPR) repeat protein
LHCSEVRAGELVERYLVGRLSEAEREAFERHLLVCDACFEELETLWTLRSTLSRERGRRATEGSAVAPGRAWRWAAAAALLLAAIGLGWWLWSRESSVWSELAAVEPPAWAPARLRGAVDESTQRFRAAMERYAKDDFEAAIPGLEEAARLDPEAAQVHFYLGACHLLTGRPARAVASLEQAAGDPLLEEPARFYLAKAQLRLGDGASARGELERVVSLEGYLEAEARELLRRIEEKSRSPG